MSRFRMWWSVFAVLFTMALSLGHVTASAASPYEWALTCDGASSSATWFWTLNDLEILDTRVSATCGPDTNGTGTRPPDANGFTVQLTSAGFLGPVTVTESGTFDPAHHFGLQATIKVNNKIPNPDYELCKALHFGSHCDKFLTISFSTTFTVKSWPS